MRRRRPLDVAIVGLACRFPGASNVDAFWENILAGRDCTGEVPPDRWDPAVFFDPGATAGDRVYCKRGGYLEAPIAFDPSAHGVMPLAVAGGEPEQFLVLDAAHAALADAGTPGGPTDGRRVEVVIGRGNYFNRGNLTRLQHGRIVAQTLAILRQLHPEWTVSDAEAVRADLKASLPPFEPGTIAAQVTNGTAGRVADRLDLGGASFVVDAASASSLLALDLGARALRDGRADLALVGGVYLQADVDFPMVFCQLGALSRRGEARPFADDADGTLPGEGVGMLVLKRRRDAERDGDRIYALLKGVGIASDGRGPGLAAPSARGHARAIRRAYRGAGIDPASVGYLEGHGLGVPASDRAELRALRAVFPPAPAGATKCALGASTALIGHAMPAAGMAGLIKAALALHHRVIPPTPHADRPHPLLADADAPFALAAAPRPWIHGGRGSPRRAGVNAFGFAGINAHAVLEEHPASADGVTPGCQTRWETEAILLSAADRPRLIARARRLLAWLDHAPNRRVPLKDLAFTLNTTPPEGACRLGLVVESTEDLRARLAGAVAKLADPGCRAIRDARGSYFREQPLGGPGTLAFVFAGEGAQYPGMLADLCRHFPEVRAWFDTADRVAREQGHRVAPSQPLFDGRGTGGTDDVDLWSIGTAVNAVLSAHWALHTLLGHLEIRPDRVLGHSSGEVLALAAAGVLEIDAAFSDRIAELGTIFERLERSGRVPTASLVAIAADRDRVQPLCREIGAGLTVALDNCPHQVIVAGPEAAVGRLVDRLRGRRVICEPLPFARAYHTAAFAAALEPIRAFFDALPFGRANVPIDSCAIAGPMPEDAAGIRRLAVEQWARPVEFRAAIEAMYAAGARVFVEVGARGNLTGFIEDTLRGRPHFAVAPCLPRRPGLTQLNHLVASLFAHGVAMKPDYLYARRRPAAVDLEIPWPSPTPAPALLVGFPEMRLSSALAARLRSSSRPSETANHHSNGRNAHATVGRGLPDGVHESPVRSDPADPRLALAQIHLRTMEQFIETQRQVMEAYLATRRGRPGHAAAAAIPGPWVGTIETHEPGRALVAVRRLDLQSDPVAAQHTLGGRKVSALDPTRLGLPVVPFTVMTEMLAQAALVLAPGRAVVGLRDVQAHRWIRYEEEPVALEIRARREPERPDQVHVTIRNRGPGAVVEGWVILGDRRQPGPVAPPWDLERPRACRFDAGMIYRDQWLFHGPALRALVEIGRASPRGIEGMLRVLPRRGLFRDGERPDLVTDPIVLDAFTHLLGCWGLDQFGDNEGDVIFPLRLGDLTIFDADPGEGAEVACRIDVREVQRHRVRVDADIVAPDGQVWMRLTGWDDWRFYWPGRYRDLTRQPDRVFVGEPLELGPTVPGGRPFLAAEAVWLEPPADFGKPIWRDVLEAIELGPEERAACRALPGPEARATLRLWGRVAAKEAVRRIWAGEGKPPVYPADLRIEKDEQGRPWVRSLIEPGRTDLPAVSIAHAQGVAVALAAADRGARVGIDVEPIADRSPEFEHLAFDASERAWLDLLAPTATRAEWVARLWCAKEAVAKASGHGLIGGPGAVRVVGADPATGVVAVVLGPELAARTPDLGDHPLRAVTARRGDHVWAWTLSERIDS